MMGRPSSVVTRRALSLRAFGLPIVLALASGCSGAIGDPDGIQAGGPGPGAGNGSGTGGTGNGNGNSNGTGGGAGTGNGNATGNGGSAGGTVGPMLCSDNQLHVARSPIRRLTRFEYNNTVAG